MNMNKYMFENEMKEIWTLQAIRIHQVEKSHHRAGDEMKEVKDQGGHHEKLNHL